MRIVPFIISALLTGALIFALNTKWGPVPPLGKFLSPQQGFWQNAEPVNAAPNEDLHFAGLKGNATAYLDDRMVPHVFAEQEEDAYFIQGYLHAKFRLWQMEFQSFYAAGRLSEKLGSNPTLLRIDRQQRRLGMVYAAENALEAMNSNPQSKAYYDAYTAGVNQYIQSLTESEMPIEYKLLDYKPEPWTNLKIALFLKLMSKDLASYERDLEFTNQKSVFSPEEMALLYPDVNDSLHAIIPNGTGFEMASLTLTPPPTADSLYFEKDTTIHTVEIARPDPNNGSNNWALTGTRTASGAPILCNDPHLGLSLPSIWFEMQISTPTMNAYGATFPGSPSVIIGFNDDIAFGFTNAMRDVKDYYSIRFRDASKKEYWYNGSWQPTKLKVETFRVAGAADVLDTIAFTAFGPVMYDESFTNEVTGNQAIAVRWVAHDPSDDGSLWFKLNRAKNYDDYREAIRGFSCPGQNMLFAGKSGEIALWQQGRFPARWKGQGLFVMPGSDSSYTWNIIPEEENPHIRTSDGYIQSANQRPVDGNYPYFIPGNYTGPRSVTIDEHLRSMPQATIQDMMRLQNNIYSSLAADALPLFIRHLDRNALTDKSAGYLNELKAWDFRYSSWSRAATIYQAWMDSVERTVLDDEFARIKGPSSRPDEETLLEYFIRDTTQRFADDIRTPQRETLAQQITLAFRQAAAALEEEEKENGLIWWKHKKPVILHLLRENALPFGRTDLVLGGTSHTPNAITRTHGPSWRMIVQLSTETEAYGIYPGGQSGNPGSRYYDNFVDPWAKGTYYRLWVMKPTESSDGRIRQVLRFSHS